jgi:hypothetical protein
MAGRKPIPEEERFWEKVDKSGPNPDYPDCWEWTGYVVKKYGHFAVKQDGVNRKLGAHVYSWQKANGKRVPEGREVCHTCNNPPCVRPDHLEAETRSHNQRYSVTHGNHKESRKTHCKHGHLYDEENTIHRISKHTGFVTRDCKTCHKRWKKERLARRREEKGIEPKKLNHCRKGHDFSVYGEKWFVKKSGRKYRTCAECMRIRNEKKKNG